MRPADISAVLGGVAHGFWPARSVVSNAKHHVSYQYTVSFDLADFFDTCTTEQWNKAVGAQGYATTPLFGGFSIEGALRQGLPTSPAASNVCAAPLDHAIVRFCQTLGDCVYTRYADDLTISCRSQQQVKTLLKEIPKLVEQANFQLNTKKTRVQCAKAGRRIITGVAVDDAGIYPTRKTKRLLRAARYRAKRKPSHHNRHRAAGLQEWCKTKPPRLGKKARHTMDQAPDASEAMRIAAEAVKYV